MARLSLRKKKPALEKPDHSALMEADPYAFASAHRRLAWVLKLLAVSHVAVLGIAAALASGFWVLLPLKEVVPMLVRADPADDRVYRIEPISRDVEGFSLLLESAARRFVKLVLEIDPVSQRDRLDEAFAMADGEYRAKFIRERIDTGALDDAIEGGLNRSVVVESAQRLSGREGVFTYAVDFVQIDERRGREIGRKPLRAYLSITTRPLEARGEDRFENPLGFTVLDLALKEKSAPGAEASLQ